jgi:hypothetical protein
LPELRKKGPEVRKALELKKVPEVKRKVLELRGKVFGKETDCMEMPNAES